MTTDKRMSPAYQRAVSEFVDRNVHACASTLISELGAIADSDYCDDILEVRGQYDWESAARDEGWSGPTYDSGIAVFFNDAKSLIGDYDDWEELCAAHDITPHTIEAYEHWIISERLAHWLTERGEMVSTDIYGLTIWGRAATGQSISIDGVICDIYDEVHSHVA